ncbi:unnamed protein product [Symbiodinium necroappetens]|uniref:Uncharacterized protein n=1 Tax=Symbiodinium necroappetens TaxID=1628268 RepID=A0A812ZPG7_9DINO|nr:unnamed protein product [Symbiodinium necroappetens]
MLIRPGPRFTFEVEVTRNSRRGNTRNLDALGFHLRPLCKTCERCAVKLCTDGSEHSIMQQSRWLEGFWQPSESDLKKSKPHLYEELRRDDEQIDDGKEVWISNEHILQEAAWIAQERKLSRLVFADTSTYILNNGATTEQKILEEFSIDVKQVLARGSRAMLVIDLDSFASLQFSESAGGMSSKSYSIGSRQLFDAAVAAFNDCRASVRSCGNVRDLDPNVQERESWCLAIIRNAYLYDLFRERTQWPPSALERDAKRRERAEQKIRRCKRCGVRYRESENKELPGNCSKHTGHPIFADESGDTIDPVPPDIIKTLLSGAGKGQLAVLLLRKVFFSCCHQQYAPRGGCTQTRHTESPDDDGEGSSSSSQARQLTQCLSNLDFTLIATRGHSLVFTSQVCSAWL